MYLLYLIGALALAGGGITYLALRAQRTPAPAAPPAPATPAPRDGTVVRTSAPAQVPDASCVFDGTRDCADFPDDCCQADTGPAQYLTWDELLDILRLPSFLLTPDDQRTRAAAVTAVRGGILRDLAVGSDDDQAAILEGLDAFVTEVASTVGVPDVLLGQIHADAAARVEAHEAPATPRRPRKPRTIKPSAGTPSVPRRKLKEAAEQVVRKPARQSRKAARPAPRKPRGTA